MITLSQAKDHLRIDGDDEDSDVSARLAMAKAIVHEYIDDDDQYHDNAVIDAAILLVLGELFAHREADADPISPTVKTLLERQRGLIYG